jgi:hypothetical protein
LVTDSRGGGQDERAISNTNRRDIESQGLSNTRNLFRNIHMNPILLIIILFLVFGGGGGGGYYGYSAYGAPGLGGALNIVLLVLLAVWLFGGMRRNPR